MVNVVLLIWHSYILHYLAGFDNFAEEVGISRDSSLKKGMSLDVEYDEKDLIKVNIWRLYNFPFVYV